MNNVRRIGQVAVAMALAAGFTGFAHAQAQTTLPSFTTAQAERGEVAYRPNCQDCHGEALDNGEFGGPPLKGGYFRNRWGSANVAVLFGYLNKTMPPDRPGQLSPQTYVDILAFILRHNGYAPGDKELPLDPEAQQTMSLTR
jgi:S-disulfanyl-L-cysteine oxidoreductase SoxD